MDKILDKNSEITSAQNNFVMKYLTFLLDDTSYALSILKIKEIIEYVVVTPIPRMPDFIKGAINLRGKLVPVIDLSERLDCGKSQINNRSSIIIIEMSFSNEVLNVGILVDAVSKVMDFKKTDIETAPTFGGSIDTDFIEGMGKVRDEFVVILNIDRILTIEDLTILAESKNTSIEESDLD